MPTCWIISGPNGAGKTTFALKYLPGVVGCLNFVNADLIASGMSPLAPESEQLAAGRIFLGEIERHVQAQNDFGFESTLAGRTPLRLIRRLKSSDWRVELIYLALPDPEMAKQRVAERKAHGGHGISEEDVERRFFRSLRNFFQVYAPEVDKTVCLHNSAAYPELIFVQHGKARQVAHSNMMDWLLAKTEE